VVPGQVRSVRFALALVLVAVLAVTVTSCRQPAGSWPGPLGRSGVNGDPVIDRASIEAFCTWRGRACPIAHVYTDRSTWEKMTRGSGWVFDNMAGFPGTLVISQGLVPNPRRADMAGCAAGSFDQYWRDFGRLMVDKGRAASIVRLGWEFNGTFMPWSALDTDVWISCYRHAALAIRAANPRVVLDWTINSHGTPAEACGGRSTNCYPGDDVVDIIGIDNYDMGPSVGSKAEFDRVAAAPDGLTWTYEFARRHGKPFSVGEWGVAPGSDWNSHGENPEFIRWMHQWFAAHAPGIAYEAYFNNCQDGEVESNLYRPAGGDCVRRNSAAADVYRELWGD
jgi:hypothetical protein